MTDNTKRAARRPEITMAAMIRHIIDRAPSTYATLQRAIAPCAAQSLHPMLPLSLHCPPYEMGHLREVSVPFRYQNQTIPLFLGVFCLSWLISHHDLLSF